MNNLNAIGDKEGLIPQDPWNLLREVNFTRPNFIEATAQVPIDSCWFSGHFPGEPILPGIALISSVWEAIVRKAAGEGREVRLCALKRVRFTKPVRPGENLLITIESSSDGEDVLYSFKINDKEDVVCSGLILSGVLKEESKEDGNA